MATACAPTGAVQGLPVAGSAAAAREYVDFKRVDLPLSHVCMGVALRVRGITKAAGRARCNITAPDVLAFS